MDYPYCRNAFDHMRVQFVCEGPSLTKQSEAEACDINVILRNYQKTGFVNSSNSLTPEFLDVSSGLDYHSSLNFVIEADAQFNRVPSAIRARFNNDAGEFLAFVSDPANRNEMIKMGLMREGVMPDAPPEPAKPVPEASSNKPAPASE